MYSTETGQSKAIKTSTNKQTTELLTETNLFTDYTVEADNSTSELIVNNFTMKALPVVKQETNHLTIILPLVLILLSALLIILGSYVYGTYKKKTRNQSRKFPNYYPKIIPPKQIQVGLCNIENELVTEIFKISFEKILTCFRYLV